MALTDDVAAEGEALGQQEVTGRPPADVPQGDAGVAAALSPPPEPAEFVALLPSRVGVCLHYRLNGRYIRENLTGPKCRERIQAMAHAPDQVELWKWKRRQITLHSPT